MITESLSVGGVLSLHHAVTIAESISVEQLVNLTYFDLQKASKPVRIACRKLGMSCSVGRYGLGQNAMYHFLKQTQLSLTGLSRVLVTQLSLMNFWLNSLKVEKNERTPWLCQIKVHLTLDPDCNGSKPNAAANLTGTKAWTW